MTRRDWIEALLAVLVAAAAGAVVLWTALGRSPLERRRWRANVLLLKAKLEFADDERSTVLRELLPYAVLTDGRTLEEAVLAGDSKVPLLAARSGS